MPELNSLKPNEHEVMIVRRHWWFFVKIFFQLILLAILSILCLIFLGFVWTSMIFLLIFALIALGLLLYYWFLWKNDVFVLTDQRIIDTNYTGLFTKDVVEFSLDKIQDVTYTQHGPIPMMANFGEVIIETAGEFKNIKIELAPNPVMIQKKISEIFQSYRTNFGFVTERNNVQNSNNSTNKGVDL